eukprot:749664-Hanusia_phi.AAC.1
MPGSLAAAKPGRFDPYNLPAAVKSFPLVLHARFATPLPAVLMLQPLRFILMQERRVRSDSPRLQLGLAAGRRTGEQSYGT